MRRSTVAIAVAALVGSVAFAPAVSDQQAAPETDHAITFSADGSETVEGSADAAGTNLGLAGASCSKSPDTYCETVHVTVEQSVADTTGDVDFGTGDVSFTLAPAVQGADFDVSVRETNADGTEAGTEVASSGNFPGCATVCESPAGAVTGEGCGPEHDECGTWTVSTNDLDGGGTKYYVIQVVYYLAGGGYTLDVAYERTDGAGGTDDSTDGGTGDGSTDDGSTTGAADSAARVDVTGGFEDVGDWGANDDLAPLGDALGQDLKAAFIEYADDTFTFTIEVTNLPAAGGVPEFTRYGWSFDYNDTTFELDGKFTNYSRGACDPTAGNCPPPRDPGIGYFAIRGNCVTNEGNVTTCEELGGVNATFDPADGTIEIPIPAEQLAPEGVAACDSITGAASFLGQSVWAAPTAFVTTSASPNDQAMHFEPLVVPHADETLSCATD